VKNVLLKVSCLVVAILVWIQVAATTMVEADVSLPLEVVGLPDTLTVDGSNLPEAGRARLRAPKLSLMANQYLGVSLGSIAIDLNNKRPGPAIIHQLNPADVRVEAEVVGLLPPVRFPVRIDVRQTRRLPVRVARRGRLPDDRVLVGSVEVRPDSVDVSGPRRFFAGLDSLQTEAVDLASARRTLTRELPLIPPPPPLRLSRSTVTVVVPVAEIDERVLANVPVLVVAESHLGEPGVSPPVCDVLVRGPADSLAALRPERLLVSVPVGDVGPGVHQVAPEVRHPAWVTAVEVTPAVFMVLVGDRDGGREPRQPEGPR
jgi:YbbR domain-containing protein